MPTQDRPQQNAAPSSARPQVRSPLAVIAAYRVLPPIAAGAAMLAVLLPTPIWPKSLNPQQAPTPSKRTAHECCVPAATSRKSDVVAMGAGVELTRSVGSPRAPRRLSPQQYTRSSIASAHV